jgi:hypothetical protein
MYGYSDSNVLNRRTPASIELCKRRAFGFSTRPAVTMRPATEESQLIYESKVKYEFSSLPIGISFLPSRVLLSRQLRPNYAAICMHAPPPSYKYAKHQKPFVLVLLQARTRSPSRSSKAVPVFPVNKESHCAHTHRHFPSYAKHAFLLLLRLLTPRQDGLRIEI